MARGSKEGKAGGTPPPDLARAPSGRDIGLAARFAPKTPRAPPVRGPPSSRASSENAPPGGKSLGVWVSTVTTLLAGIAPLAVGYVAVGQGNVGLAFLTVLLGIANVILSFLMYRVDFRAWGSVLIMDVFIVIIGLGVAQYALVAVAAVSLGTLYVFRLEYNVGAWKIEARKEKEAHKELEGVRMSNPGGLHCRACGSTRLWVGPDGSAVCLDCMTGTTRIAAPTHGPLPYLPPPPP